MSNKTWIWIGLFVGSTVGQIVPTLFHAGLLSSWAIFSSAIGGLLGIWAGFKFGQYISG